jgi:hypothetical protein
MKMRFAKLWVNILVFACAIVCTSTSFATEITVENFSFEELPLTVPPAPPLPNPCGPGCSYSAGAIPHWDASGAVGQFLPGSNPPDNNHSYFNSIPDGNAVAYANDGSISQTVGATVELGVLYTLTVDQGARNDVGDPGIVELLIGHNAPILAATKDPLVPGGWQEFTATYTGLAGDVGKSITIALLSGGAQGDWDNVHLEAFGTIPEPGSISLIGVALVALAGVARRSSFGRALDHPATIGN